MSFENKNLPLENRGLPLADKSHPLHSVAVQFSKVQRNRYFNVSASIDPDSYSESLACELGISLEAWVSLIKFDGLSLMSRYKNPIVAYENWCEVLGLNPKHFVFTGHGRKDNLKRYMCRLHSEHDPLPVFNIDKTVHPLRFSKTDKGKPYEIKVAENRRGVVTIEPLSAVISTSKPTCKKKGIAQDGLRSGNKRIKYSTLGNDNVAIDAKEKVPPQKVPPHPHRKSGISVATQTNINEFASPTVSFVSDNSVVPLSPKTYKRKAKLLAFLLQQLSTDADGISQSIHAKNIIKMLVGLRSTKPLQMNKELNDDAKTKNHICNNLTRFLSNCSPNRCGSQGIVDTLSLRKGLMLYVSVRNERDQKRKGETRVLKNSVKKCIAGTKLGYHFFCEVVNKLSLVKGESCKREVVDGIEVDQDQYTIIEEYIRNFEQPLQPNNKGGFSRATAAQEAHDTIIQASVSEKNTEIENKRIFRHLGVYRGRKNILLMLKDNSDSGKFSLPKRKTRGIDTTTIVKTFVVNFSRDDDVAWCDPNLNITVYENGVPIPSRVWIDPTWAMRVSAFNNSAYVARLREAIKKPAFNITKKVLRRFACRSAREGSSISCSDYTRSGMDSMLKALAKALHNHKNCFETEEQKNLLQLGKKVTDKLSKSLIEHSLCKQTNQSGLDVPRDLLIYNVSADDTSNIGEVVSDLDFTNNNPPLPFVFFNYECYSKSGSCTHCRLRKNGKNQWLFGVDNKDVIPGNPTLDVEVWEKLMHSSGSMEQLTLVVKKMTAEELIMRIEDAAPSLIDHMCEETWEERRNQRELYLATEIEVIVESDFTATPDLKSKMEVTAAMNNHCAIEITRKRHSARYVKLHSGVTVKVFTVEMHHSILPTLKGHKLTNALTHGWHMDTMLGEHCKKYPLHKTFFIHTDCCAAQYSCGENIYNKIQLAKKYDIDIHVLFCVPRTGKGACDGQGKVLKHGVRKLTLSETPIFVNNGIEFYKVALEHFPTPTYAERNKKWETNLDCKLIYKRMSIDSYHYYLHCANEDIFNCATLALGEGDAHVFKHSIPYPSYYTKIKDFTKFSHFKMLRDGTASYNLNHCRCDSCEKGDSCLHPLQKGEMHELEMNKVEAKGGTVTTTTGDATKTKHMELAANTNDAVTTISDNGTEGGALNKDTIVVNFICNQGAERSS